jgi:hypothetical protein
MAWSHGQMPQAANGRHQKNSIWKQRKTSPMNLREELLTQSNFLLKRPEGGTANSKNKDRIDMEYWDKYDINTIEYDPDHRHSRANGRTNG